MGMMRDLAFAAFAALSLAACGSPAHVDRGAHRGSPALYYNSGSQADVDIAELGAAWFDGFTADGRAHHRGKPTAEEINAYLHSRGRGSLFTPVSHAKIGAFGH